MMSGPIIRKYGFPNFEKIFGNRAPQHGVEEETTPEEAPAPASTPPEPAESAAKKPAEGSQKKN